MIWVALCTTTPVASTVPNLTATGPLVAKLEPTMTTVVPPDNIPVVGENPVIVGAGPDAVYEKPPIFVQVTPGIDTETSTVVAVDTAGVKAVICVALLTVKF